MNEVTTKAIIAYFESISVQWHVFSAMHDFKPASLENVYIWNGSFAWMVLFHFTMFIYTSITWTHFIFVGENEHANEMPKIKAMLAFCLTEYAERSCASYDWFENLGYALHLYGYYEFSIRFMKIIIQNLWSLMNFWRDGCIKSREMAAILFSHSHKIQFIHKNNLKKWLNMHTDWNILHINERRLKPIYRRFSWNSHSYSKSNIFFLLLNGSCNRFNSYANFTHDSDHFMMQKYL